MAIKNRKPRAKKKKPEFELKVVYNFCVVCKDEMKVFGDVCEDCLEKDRIYREKQKKQNKK